MTINIADNNPRVSYSVSAGVTQTSFAVPFEFFDETDVLVYIDSTLKTITTDYTVSGGDGTTGTITMSVTGPATVALVRDITIERSTDFPTAGPFSVQSLNVELDKQIAIDADISDQIDRAVRSPIEEFTTMTLPDAATRADKILKFDTDGNVGVETASALFAGAVVGANFTNNTFTGDGSQTAFTTTVEAGSKNNAQVYIDGVYQLKSSFSVSGLTLTFTEAPPLNSQIEVIIGNAIDTLDADSGNINYNQGGTGAQTRTVENKLQEFVSVKDFGATGDGVTDDSAAIQAAVDSGAKRIYFPAGTYYSSTKITTQHTGSYYRRDTGQVFFGDGIETILTRNQAATTQGATETNWDANAFFAVYGSYNEFHQMQFYDCPVAIYFGQDPANIGVERSHTSFNKMQNLLIQNCGTGILSAASEGHYYNHYEAIHIAQCQIGVYFTTHSSWPSPSVSQNNRNTLQNIRASRCQVGFWLSNGDTNSVYSFHCEGCGATPTNNPYSSPSGLPASLTTAAFIIEADNNDFFGCFHEGCDFYIYHDALFTQSFGNLFRIAEDPSDQNFVTPFYHHFARTEAWINNGSFASISNLDASAFPNTPAGASTIKGPEYLVGNKTNILTLASANQISAVDQLVEIGAVAALGTADFTLSQEISSQDSCSDFFEVTVVGNSQTNNLVHSNTFKVIVLRNSSRTPTRYYVYDQVIGRATGANTGDSTEAIVPSLSLGGINTKDVIVTLTMPNRTFESISVLVKQLHSQA